MSAEITRLTGGSVELIAGSRGIFDVKQDGKLLFSKYQHDRFPDPGELGRLIHSQD